MLSVTINQDTVGCFRFDGADDVSPDNNLTPDLIVKLVGKILRLGWIISPQCHIRLPTDPEDPYFTSFTPGYFDVIVILLLSWSLITV